MPPLQEMLHLISEELRGFRVEVTDSLVMVGLDKGDVSITEVECALHDLAGVCEIKSSKNCIYVRPV